MVKKIFHENRDKQKSGVAILISEEIIFKMKIITRHKESPINFTSGYLSE